VSNVSNDLEDLTRVEPRRDRYGRPLILPKGGDKPVAYTRPTTIADTLDDRHNLELWMQRQVALGLAARPDLVARIATTSPDDKGALNGICSDARDAAGSSAAANMGTAIHAAVEQVNRGHDAPAMFADAIAEYTAALERHGLTVNPDHVERFCVNEPIHAAGTFDMIVEHDGRSYIADLKTGASIAWSGRSFAVQLAIYAGATSYYDVATDTHSDPVDVDRERAIIVHLPAAGGPCTIHWLDIAAGREALEHALWVRRWRKNDDLVRDLEPVERPKARRKSAGKPKRTLEPVPMPDLPPETEAAARANARPAPMLKLHPSEGDLVAVELVHELRDRALASDEEPTIRRWVQESRDAHCDYSMGRGLHSERRFLISSASVTLAEGGDGDEWARAVLAVVLGDDAHKLSVTVGQLLGTLTREQAVTVDELARTAVAHYDDAGRLQVVPA
jgi:hypothetical protein